MYSWKFGYRSHFSVDKRWLPDEDVFNIVILFQNINTLHLQRSYISGLSKGVKAKKQYHCKNIYHLLETSFSLSNHVFVAWEYTNWQIFQEVPKQLWGHLRSSFSNQIIFEIHTNHLNQVSLQRTKKFPLEEVQHFLGHYITEQNDVW